MLSEEDADAFMRCKRLARSAEAEMARFVAMAGARSRAVMVSVDDALNGKIPLAAISFSVASSLGSKLFHDFLHPVADTAAK